MKGNSKRLLASALAVALTASMSTLAFATDGSTKKGDLNNDSKVDILDVVLMRSSIVGNSTLTDSQTKAADLNDDGKIDIVDVVNLRDAIVNGKDLGEVDKPVDTDTDKPVDTDTDKPVDTDTDKPVDTDTDKPVDTDTDKPVDTDTDKPVDTDTDKPVDTDTEPELKLPDGIIPAAKGALSGGAEVTSEYKTSSGAVIANDGNSFVRLNSNSSLSIEFAVDEDGEYNVKLLMTASSAKTVNGSFNGADKTFTSAEYPSWDADTFTAELEAGKTNTITISTGDQVYNVCILGVEVTKVTVETPDVPVETPDVPVETPDKPVETPDNPTMPENVIPAADGTLSGGAEVITEYNTSSGTTIESNGNSFVRLNSNSSLSIDFTVDEDGEYTVKLLMTASNAKTVDGSFNGTDKTFTSAEYPSWDADTFTAELEAGETNTITISTGDQVYNVCILGVEVTKVTVETPDVPVETPDDTDTSTDTDTNTDTEEDTNNPVNVEDVTKSVALTVGADFQDKLLAEVDMLEVLGISSGEIDLGTLSFTVSFELENPTGCGANARIYTKSGSNWEWENTEDTWVNSITWGGSLDITTTPAINGKLMESKIQIYEFSNDGVAQAAEGDIVNITISNITYTVE